ncbi:MAG: inner-membrane translocator [Bacilli bacterium]|nr:inner-membrane translocator [Bacilli bacterium]
MKFDKYRLKKLVIALLPLVALIALFVAYLIILNANDYNVSMNLKTLLNQSIVLILVATGAIFIFTLGQFDISLGANTLFAAVIGTLAYKASGNIFVLFLVCIVVAVACSLLNAVIASIFHLPMFVTTIAMLSVLTALATFLIQSEGTASGTSFSITLPSNLVNDLSAIDTPAFKISVVVIFMVLMIFIFNFTKVGRKMKFLGGNQNCAKLTGISVSLFGIIAFALAGLGAGLGSSMTVVYAHTVSTTTASSIGMSVFIAIVFGGMPINGGARSRIYSALIGGISYNLMTNILFILFQSMQGVRDGLVQVISGIFFLAIVFVASINYRSKNLPR